MNCPSRTDEPLESDGWNQSPPGLAADLTTREDMNGMVNRRTQRDSDPPLGDDKTIHTRDPISSPHLPRVDLPEDLMGKSNIDVYESPLVTLGTYPELPANELRSGTPPKAWFWDWLHYFGNELASFTKFIGPGFMVSVAYIDPGNYSTDVAAGSKTKFKLLFIVLMSNVFAIILQSLAVRLGSVTGLNLAEHCRAHLPRWLNLFLYVLGEGAIIATDIAEVGVIGSAIALNLLLKIPLVAGCALTLVDVLIILIFYSPDGSMRRLRAFELFVMALVLGVVVCFCIELSLINDTSVGEVFKGYLPSSTVIKDKGVYLSCGILGATVMPHSLYLGSGIVQPRLRQFDKTAGTYNTSASIPSDGEKVIYRPSLAAVRSCMTYSTVEVGLCLFTFALFVNSAILIVAGASLSSNSAAESADLFGIHKLLATTLAPVAGTIFALALLLSGTSAGIVCTIAGQMLSEGALNWTIAPWMRRLITRSISITPSIIIAAAVGKDGLSNALNGTQIALSVALPFVSAPLIYFTCRNKYMVVGGARPAGQETDHDEVEPVKMRNHWVVSVLAVAIWLIIAIMNVSLLVLVGLGKA